MKRIISFMLAVVLTMSLVGCGEIKQVGTNDGNNTQAEVALSPEVNVKDEFYTKVLSFSPVTLAGWTLHAMGIYDSVEDYSWLYERNKALRGFDDEDTKVMVIKPETNITSDIFFAQFNSDKAPTEWTEDTIPESIKNRKAWEEKNQFFFCADESYYYGTVREDVNRYSYLKDNTLAVVYYDKYDNVFLPVCS